MDIIIIGHILQIVGILFAFVAVAVDIILLKMVKKEWSRLSRSALYEVVGITVLALNVFLLYGSAITGKLDLLHPTLFWPLSGFMTAIGFGFFAYSKWYLLHK